MNPEKSYHYMYRALEPDFAMHVDAQDVVYTPDVLKAMFLDKTLPIEDQPTRYQDAVAAMSFFLSAAHDVDHENNYGYAGVLDVPTDLLYRLSLVPDTAVHNPEEPETDDHVSFNVSHEKGSTQMMTSYVGRFKNPQLLSDYLAAYGGPVDIPVKRGLFAGLPIETDHSVHAQFSEIWHLTDEGMLSETMKTMDDIHVHLGAGQKFIVYSDASPLNVKAVSSRSLNRMLTMCYLKMAQVDLSQKYGRDLTKYPFNVARIAGLEPGRYLEVLEDEDRSPYRAEIISSEGPNTTVAVQGVIFTRSNPKEVTIDKQLIIPSSMIVRPL